MWEFSGAADEHKFLIIARSHRDRMTGNSGRPVALGNLSGELRERLILYGALSPLHDAGPVGVALAVQARRGKRSTGSLRRGGVGLNVFPDIEIHD